MAKTVAKVVYKPDTQSTDSYIVIVNPEEYKKWKDGGHTIPLVDVVDSFEIFHSTQGAQGHLNRTSKQELDAIFGSTKEDDCVTHVLQKGTLQITSAGDKYTTSNDAQQGHNQVSRGAAGHGGR
ncbi:hypothetical protein OC846_000037 [Tilletia horrida]|uniref:Ribosome maturation protein SDO1/SBDS N-terminal domain-containing protein n=1 Tax=Tilletia horrida TaxID=155126 RepID=A0AAN6JUV4_9BASI|nr:hypothetical protein OC846_000037 [Tilletia horrida]